jgi:hypothetical protein
LIIVIEKKIIFSGGSLYKTLGGNNKYYSMIDSILKKYTNTIFLYAGTGDSTKINELMKKMARASFIILMKGRTYMS